MSKVNTLVNSFDRGFDNFSDSLPPSANVELKQLLNNKIFSFGFILSCIFISLLSILMFFSSENTGLIGAGLFLIIQTFLDFTLILLIPFILFQNFLADCSNGSFELLNITATSPSKLLLGKWLSSLIQMFFVTSLVSPCIIFSYLLGGLDFRLILYSLFFTFFVSQLCCLLALFLCCIAWKKVARIVNQVVTFGILFFIFTSTAGIHRAFIFFSSLELQNFYNSIGIFEILKFFGIVLAFEPFLFFVSTANISGYSANRSTLPRIMYSFYIIVLGVTIFFSRLEVAGPLFFTIFIHTFVSYVFFTEKNKLSARLYKKWSQKSSLINYIFVRVFYPGKSSAFILFYFQTLFLICCYYFSVQSTWDERLYVFMILCTANIILCLNIAFLALLVFHRLFKKAKFSHSVIVSLFAIMGYFICNIIFVTFFPFLKPIMKPLIFTNIMPIDIYFKQTITFDEAVIAAIITFALTSINLFIAILTNKRQVDNFREFNLNP